MLKRKRKEVSLNAPNWVLPLTAKSVKTIRKRKSARGDCIPRSNGRKRRRKSALKAGNELTLLVPHEGRTHCPAKFPLPTDLSPERYLLRRRREISLVGAILLPETKSFKKNNSFQTKKMYLFNGRTLVKPNAERATNPKGIRNQNTSAEAFCSIVESSAVNSFSLSAHLR